METSYNQHSQKIQGWILTYNMAKIGDIFVATWGYEQTNADFFQIIGLTAKGVKVRHIKSKQKIEGQTMVGTSIPIKNAFDGEVHTRRIYLYEGQEMFQAGESYGSAELWDGNPVNISTYA